MTRAELCRATAAALVFIWPMQVSAETQLDRLQRGRDTVEVLNQQLDAQTLQERIAASKAAQARSEAELKRVTLPAMPTMPSLPQPIPAPAMQLPPPVVTAVPPRPPAAARQPAAERVDDIALLGTMGVDGRHHATFRTAGAVITDIQAGSVLPDGSAVDQIGDGYATIKRRGKSFTLRVTAFPAGAAAPPLPAPITVPMLPTNLVPVQ